MIYQANLLSQDISDPYFPIACGDRTVDLYLTWPDQETALYRRLLNHLVFQMKRFSVVQLQEPDSPVPLLNWSPLVYSRWARACEIWGTGSIDEQRRLLWAVPWPWEGKEAVLAAEAEMLQSHQPTADLRILMEPIVLWLTPAVQQLKELDDKLYWSVRCLFEGEEWFSRLTIGPTLFSWSSKVRLTFISPYARVDRLGLGLCKVYLELPEDG